MKRSTIIGLAALLVLGLFSSTALARHGGGNMGGHVGGGHWGGGHWSGGNWGGGHWGGHSRFAFHGARFRHHGRFFVGFAGYDYGCWRLRPTPWGWRRVWVCGYPYYGYF